jgi:hypothetical protein
MKQLTKSDIKKLKEALNLIRSCQVQINGMRRELKKL